MPRSRRGNRPPGPPGGILVKITEKFQPGAFKFIGMVHDGPEGYAGIVGDIKAGGYENGNAVGDFYLDGL
jgi:hypothetical protein